MIASFSVTHKIEQPLFLLIKTILVDRQDVVIRLFNFIVPYFYIHHMYLGY